MRAADPGRQRRAALAEVEAQAGGEAKLPAKAERQEGRLSGIGRPNDARGAPSGRAAPSRRASANGRAALYPTSYIASAAAAG